MPTVGHLIQRLLPNGTRPGKAPDWALFPDWPPDAFAVSARLLDASGAYCNERYTTPSTGFAFDLKTIGEASAAWGDFAETSFSWPSAEKHLQALWDVLIANQHKPVRVIGAWKKWADAAFELLAIADSACEGVGFVPEASGLRPLADFVATDHLAYLRGDAKNLPSMPHSICRMVPADEACVQPKTRTPQVGCTLRSLSHHLALLPPLTEVNTSWRFGVDMADIEEQPSSSLNILVVPYPYTIPGTCFVAGPKAGTPPLDGGGAHYFGIDQKWLRPQGRRLSAASFVKFLKDLLSAARSHVGVVDGIVLPELALDASLAEQVADGLRATGIEFFISGILEEADSGMPVNAAYSMLYSDGTAFAPWQQNKHHRWKLDGDQIRRYHLGDRLDPSGVWWEQISVSERHCYFYVFRRGISMATLICEDLARIDPVQTVIRAVGPSLVIALLMDGPQWQRRWSGRYATVLADDPGSAVLSVTSQGMLNRSRMPGEAEIREVALWKGSDGVAHELKLDPGTHALLLTLSVVGETNYTLDGRSDSGLTLGLTLSGTHSIAASNPPPWLTKV